MICQAWAVFHAQFLNNQLILITKTARLLMIFSYLFVARYFVFHKQEK